MKSPFNDNGLFPGANNLLFARARVLRHNMTDAENILWLHLRHGIKGLKFRRQHPFNNYIVDFYCHKVKLIIEVDGSVHKLQGVIENDIQRQNQLISLGYHVMRFENKDVLHSIEEVIQTIEKKIEYLLTNNFNIPL